MSSALIKAELAATCGTLGHLHNDQYVIDSQCYESVRDLIRFLRRDDEYHEIRRYLGEAKIVQSDLIHIIETCTSEQGDLFDITIRLLVNLTNPILLLYKEELPSEKVGRNIYLNLVQYLQEYKIAFTRIEALKKISNQLSNLFEIDWTERTDDNSLQIERLLVLIRNILQIPTDVEAEKRAENDVNMHDQVLWGLRQSQILELLLYISSNREEEQYFIHILEILSLILREQDPSLLAQSELNRAMIEKEKDNSELLNIRDKEKDDLYRKRRHYTRHLSGTYVMKNVKSISEQDVVYHRSLHKINDLNLGNKKKLKTPKNRVPEESVKPVRRSTFSVRLFLKELSIEFISSSYNILMSVVKDKLVSGKALSNDESYYFWALTFFMQFNRNANLDIKHISETVNIQTFHYVQTQMEHCFEMIMVDKKKISLWIKRLHIILKAYKELLETLSWMDRTSEYKQMSLHLQSKLFYMVEYRELVIYCLLKYDPYKYSKSYFKDLIETLCLFLKLFKFFCDKQKNVVVQEKKKTRKPKKYGERKTVYSVEEKWAMMERDLIKILETETDFPEITPFDAASDTDIEEQKEDAMRRIQRLFHAGQLREGIGLLRAARQVWPENDYFGAAEMTAVVEMSGINDIFLAELGNKIEEAVEEEEDDSDGGQDDVQYSEQVLDFSDFIKKLANKRIVEGCCIMLENYEKNSDYTNHCVVKVLHKIGWDCFLPAMLFQASFFKTLLKILKANNKQNKEMNKFAMHVVRKFRENAAKNPKIYMELLFWKDPKVALDIESGYVEQTSSGKSSGWSEEEEDELRRLWMEYEETKPQNPDKVDWVMCNMINNDRTRRSVNKKLRELMLLAPGPIRKVSKRPPKQFSEEEIAEIKDLFEKLSGAYDILSCISDRLTIKRPKARIKELIVELGLVKHHSELNKRRGKKQSKVDELLEEEEDESESEVEIQEEETQVFSLNEQKQAVQDVSQANMTEALEWLKESFQDYCDEFDPADEGCPLLAIDEAHVTALESELFTDLLKKLGLTPPSGQQMYWRIPSTFTPKHSKILVDMIQKVLNGEIDSGERPNQMDSSSEEDDISYRKNKNELSSKRRNIGSDSEDDETKSNSSEKLSRRVPETHDSDEGSRSPKTDIPERAEDTRTNEVSSNSENEETRHHDLRVIGSDSDGSNTSLRHGKRGPRRRTIGSDSDNEVSVYKTGKRNRMLINSDSEDELNGNRFGNDKTLKKRRAMFDSDSEKEEDSTFSQPRQILHDLDEK